LHLLLLLLLLLRHHPLQLAEAALCRCNCPSRCYIVVHQQPQLQKV
jgi:hypothetical protein